MTLAPEQVRIRAARTEDLGVIAGIFAHYVRHSVATFEETPPTVRDWEVKLASLRELALPFLVAEAGADVGGYAYASPWRPKPAYRRTVEDSVYLAPGWTGQGLGTLLLTALLARCAQAGSRQMIAVIADSGQGASAALHRACGFTDAGRLVEVGFKHGRWIDTVLMQRQLTTARQADRAASDNKASPAYWTEALISPASSGVSDASLRNETARSKVAPTVRPAR